MSVAYMLGCTWKKGPRPKLIKKGKCNLLKNLELPLIRAAFLILLPSSTNTVFTEKSFSTNFLAKVSAGLSFFKPARSLQDTKEGERCLHHHISAPAGLQNTKDGKPHLVPLVRIFQK